ncbi:MAG: hypothetical protein RIR16_345 [Actinomycetota bacterium]|jgi:predicted  nucleic acid-binding Zn-ribbon protein
MKTSPQIEKSLLDLAQLDLALARIKAEVTEHEAGVEYRIANQAVIDFGLTLTAKRNEIESLQLDVERAAADLEVVESRIQRDQSLLNSNVSAKEISGIQHELVSLQRRKDELENAELEIMESLEQRQQELAALSLEHHNLAEIARGKAEQMQQALLKSKSDLQLKTELRAKTANSLPVDVLELYESRATRGVAVGTLSGRECGACRISLGATDFELLNSAPKDQIAFCPECQAILLRTL